MTLGLAERRVCRVLGQARSTQRYQRESPSDEAPLTAAIIALASQYGRYGYRQVLTTAIISLIEQESSSADALQQLGTAPTHLHYRWGLAK